MRHFIRHPANIPIEVSTGGPLARTASRVDDVSIGGLAFRSVCELEPGRVVELRIPFVQPPFKSKARVVWCRGQAGQFELGVEFLDAEDAFRARMVEQVCYIENYQKEVYRTQGRVLTAEEAALEWITKHAAQFPAPGPEEMH